MVPETLAATTTERLAESDVERLGTATAVNDRAVAYDCGCCEAGLLVRAGTTVVHGTLQVRCSVLGEVTAEAVAEP